MVTRSKNGIQKLKAYITELDGRGPHSTKEALKCLHSVEAMNEEYRALMRNNTCELVSKPPNKKIIGSK